MKKIFAQKGAVLVEIVIAALLAGVVAAIILPRGDAVAGEFIVEREAQMFASDLRSLQEQSRSNGYRALGLNHFHSPTSTLEMQFYKNGYRVQQNSFTIIYKHDFPAEIDLALDSTSANAPRLTNTTVNFGHDGGSVKNCTFRLSLKNSPSVCRYVIISSSGRIRIDRRRP